MSEAELAALRDRVKVLERDLDAWRSSDSLATAIRDRAILRSIVDFAVIATGLDGRITYWNAGADTTLGWSASEMLGHTAARLFTPEDVQAGQIDREMEQSVANGRADDERWHLRKDGTRFWASGEMMPLRDQAGRHIGYLKILRDRTREHHAGLRLQEAEDRARRAQAAGGIGLFSVGMDGMLYATPEFCRLYGVAEREQIPVVEFERLVIPADAELVSTSATRMSGRAPLDVEYRIRRADTGELRWINRRGEIERGVDGRTARFVGAARDITDQMKDRLLLAEEREQLAQMFEQAPTFMALLRGPDHRVERANPGYIALVGRDIVGRTIAEALPDAVAQGFLTLLDTVYRTGEPYTATDAPYAVQVSPDAPVRHQYVDFVYQPIRDVSGAVTGIFVEGADVTARAKATIALRASEERYQALFKTVDVGFCILELKFDAADVAIDYRIAEANPAFERQTGLYGQIGKWVSEIAPDLERHWFEMYGRVALTGEPLHFENGAESFGRWYDVRALRIGEPSEHRVAVLFSDITDRRRMEEALRTRNVSLEERVEQRTRERDQLWTISHDPFLISDENGIWLAVSPAWTEILGWSEAELLNRTSEWMEHPDDRTKTRTEVSALSLGKPTLRFENRFRAKDGSYRWFSWTAAAIDGRIYCVARDVTLEREQAAVLAETEERLRQAQKMEAVGQLTGGLAHDFNNLLTGITGSLELLTRRIAQGRLGDVERYTTAAQGAAKRAAALTHRLLAFSRRQTLDPKSTDLNGLASGMEDFIRRTVGPTIDLTFTGADDLWPTFADPNQLENALLNLCINARDAMPDGGRLTVETANNDLDAASARLRDLEPGQYVSLCVTDTGVGMSPEVIAKAFDPFFTTKPIGVGTGLGLSMIYGFARQSGGQVRIDSRENEGTSVCIYLPRHAGSVSAVEDVAAQIGDARAVAGETVLVVDDEHTVRLLVTEVLEELGYAAVEAVDGASGLKILESDLRIDLLVTDVGLPGGMNGRQMADAARSVRPDLNVLFITGYAEAAAVGHGYLDPGMHVMTKPFALDALALKIRELISDRKDPA